MIAFSLNIEDLASNASNIFPMHLCCSSSRRRSWSWWQSARSLSCHDPGQWWFDERKGHLLVLSIDEIPRRATFSWPEFPRPLPEFPPASCHKYKNTKIQKYKTTKIQIHKYSRTNTPEPRPPAHCQRLEKRQSCIHETGNPESFHLHFRKSSFGLPSPPLVSLPKFYPTKSWVPAPAPKVPSSLPAAIVHRCELALLPSMAVLFRITLNSKVMMYNMRCRVWLQLRGHRMEDVGGSNGRFRWWRGDLTPDWEVGLYFKNFLPIFISF